MDSCAQQGASLVEVMVAALVLGIGLLGILSLQSRSLQFSQQSYLATQATILAQDMAEKISINRAAAGGYTGAGSSAKDCSSDACTATEIAAWDKYNWVDRLSSELPSGTGDVVQKNGSDGTYYEISVSFQLERDSSGDDSEETIRLVVSP